MQGECWRDGIMAAASNLHCPHEMSSILFQAIVGC